MPAQKAADLLPLIERLYSAAITGEGWQALAPDIGTTFGSSSVVIFSQENGMPQILSVTADIESSLPAYQQYFWQHDIWVQGSLRLPPAEVAASQDIVSAATFQQTEFYRDWYRLMDLFHMVGARFPTDTAHHATLGIHRARRAGLYQESDKANVRALLPHLQRALQVRSRLRQAELTHRASFEALSRSGTAILVVTAAGELLLANPEAEALLRVGSALRLQQGRIAAVRPIDSQRLLGLIQSASAAVRTGHDPGGVLSLPRNARMPLSILVTPFPARWSGIARPSAILFIRDPERAQSFTAALAGLFRLTPTEAAIAQGLIDGRSLNEIAAARHCSPQTVRKQLKIIFEKTGTHRQAQCVAVMLRSVAALSPD